MYNKFEESISSRMSDAKDMVSRIMDFLEANCIYLISDDKFYLKLMFSELLFNAIRHGNKSDEKKRVNVLVTISDDGICASIEDEGDGFDFSSVTSDITCSGANLYAESGRGIRLVHALADEISFNKTGNEIRFFKRIDTIG